MAIIAGFRPLADWRHSRTWGAGKTGPPSSFSTWIRGTAAFSRPARALTRMCVLQAVDGMRIEAQPHLRDPPNTSLTVAVPAQVHPRQPPGSIYGHEDSSTPWPTARPRPSAWVSGPRRTLGASHQVEGGITFAQAPETTGTTECRITRCGAVDFVLPIDRIGQAPYAFQHPPFGGGARNRRRWR